MKLSIGFLSLALLTGFQTARADEDIAARLAKVPGSTVRELSREQEPSIPVGYRRFEMLFEQPIDHSNPAGGVFQQKLAILHKADAEPVVLQTSGYKIFSVGLSALAKGFSTNQIQVEHRFFDQSVPATMDWSKLDIVQSANDFHRITQELRKVYTGRWVGTGASKGGMTSIFHRRFFPQDLDGTVADVAPLSYTTDDVRYIDFVNQASGDKYRDCREKLRALQIGLFQRREEILKNLRGTYVILGGKSVAFEHSVIELPFAFWQYLSPEDPILGCNKIPAPDAEASEAAAFLSAVSPLSEDETLLGFMPYYYQAHLQLGSPAAELTHLNEFRKHGYALSQYTPPGVPVPYSDSAMRDVENWVRTEASGIVFIYGQFDPWTAGAYPKPAHDANLHKIVPGGSHRANLFALPKADKEEVIAKLRVWFNKPEIADAALMAPKDTLDEVEANIRQRLKLP